YVFYHNLLIAAGLSVLGVLYPRIRKKQIIEKRKIELNFQFKDMIYCISSSLNAGKSVEMAFKSLKNDLSIEYPDDDAFIIRESEYIARKIDMNTSVEVALQDFADRSHLEDVQNFVDVFKTCKSMGGNMIDIIKNSTDILNDKIDIKNDIDTLLSARKFEQKVLNLMPVLIILVMSIIAADYVAPIYETILGKVVTTISILLLLVAYFISAKIIKIDV
ncbi:MAG: pilus assembly protein TadB, partial [Clostridiales bacterium]